MIHTIINKLKSSFHALPHHIHYLIKIVVARLTDFTHKYSTEFMNKILWDIHLDSMPRGYYEALSCANRIKYRFKTFSCLYLDSYCQYHRLEYKDNVSTDYLLSDKYVRNKIIMNAKRIRTAFYVAFYINNHLKKCRKLHKKLCYY